MLSAEQRGRLEAELDGRIYMSAKEVCTFVLRGFELTYTAHAMAKLLVRLGYVCKQPKNVPAKANPLAQQIFLDQTLAPPMAQAAADPAEPLYIVDVTREADRITGCEMIALFEEIEQRNPTATTINLVLDNATYNRAAAVREWLTRDGNRTRLVYLPPYAPNLNLIERLWWYFKKKTLWNTDYPTFAAFRNALRHFFETIGERKAELATRITDKFHLIGETKIQISAA